VGNRDYVSREGVGERDVTPACVCAKASRDVREGIESSQKEVRGKVQ